MRLEDVIGHKALKEHLLQGIRDNRVSHALLFTGAVGSGTFPLALAYASEVLVHSSQNPDSSRLKCDKLIHPDLHFTVPVNTNGRVKEKPKTPDFLEEWREAFLANPYLSLFDWLSFLGIENKQGIINVYQASVIMRTLALKSFESGYKVMVIWMPERMNGSTANKLLKLLEEPPAQTLFVLVSEQPEQLLPTILSRTQIIRVPPLTQVELQEALVARHGLSTEQASQVALLADGDYNQARHALDSDEDEVYFQTHFQRWMRLLYSKKVYELLDFVDEAARMGRERQKRFFQYGLHLFRECLIHQYGTDSLKRLTGEEAAFVERFAPFVNAANAVLLVDAFEKAAYHIERNANAKILFLDLSFKVMKMLRMTPAA